MGYNLDALGWLQFQRLCDHAFGIDRALWSGSADEVRVAVVEDGLELPLGWGTAAGPAAVVAVWVPASDTGYGLAARAARAPDQAVLVTNLDVEPDGPRVVVGARRLGALLDADPGLRLRVPSVLGVRPLAELVPAARASTLDTAAAHALARVFAPTRAYDRALDVLERHGFAVLTGPPEMGKTAIARTVGLAQLTAGWEVHECLHPEEVLDRADDGRAQLFIADDAFGSTEYRPDAAERWARELPAILRLTDERHWLIWTSRPAPLRAGLHRVHQERGAERFPSPAQVQVDAGALDSDEKASILFRHARAADLDELSRAWLREHCVRIVAHRHFTPERIRRLVARRGLRGNARGVLEQELGAPTEAMATSLAALEDEHRDVLIALLDAPPGPVSERELAASLRRHHAGGLTRAPAELIERLTDHFVQVLA
jgi:hypothetical protein